MNSFVRLRLHDEQRDEFVDRWFNVNVIRHIEPDTNKVMLNGARVPVTVSTDSIESLMQEVKNDEALKKVPFLINKCLNGLTGTDIASMQRDLDAYNMSFVNIIGYLNGSFTGDGATRKPAIMEGIAATDEVNFNIEAICEAAFDLVKERDNLKKQLAELSAAIPRNDAATETKESILMQIKEWIKGT